MPTDRGIRFVVSGMEFTEPRTPTAVMPTGRREIRNFMRTIRVGGGPGAQEEQYKGGTTSASEFYIIWALRQIFKSEPNGGEGWSWTYQSSVMGGRHMPGGAVVDFVVFGALYNIGLRIQTYYWHFEPGSVKQASDLDQKLGLEDNGMRVMDIYEQDFIHDETGKSAIRVTLEALQGLERPNPRAGGMTAVL